MVFQYVFSSIIQNSLNFYIELVAGVVPYGEAEPYNLA